MKRLTNPTLTFTIPDYLKEKIAEVVDTLNAKITFKQGTQIIFCKYTKDSTLLYDAATGIFTTQLKTTETKRLSPGPLQMELSFIINNDDYYIADTITTQTEQVLTTGWDDMV